jgi:hypothetical protein
VAGVADTMNILDIITLYTIPAWFLAGIALVEAIMFAYFEMLPARQRIIMSSALASFALNYGIIQQVDVQLEQSRALTRIAVLLLLSAFGSLIFWYFKNREELKSNPIMASVYESELANLVSHNTVLSHKVAEMSYEIKQLKEKKELGSK